MTLRTAFQYAAFALNAMILLTSLIGFYLRPDKRPSLILWILYGLAGTVFYTVVLVFGLGAWGNSSSPIRSLVQDALVASSLLFPTLSDVVRKWKR